MSNEHIIGLLIEERTKLDAAIQALSGVALKKRPGRPRKEVVFDFGAPNVPDWVKPAVKKSAPAKKKGGLSAQGRANIVAALKKRHADAKAAKETALKATKRKKAP